MFSFQQNKDSPNIGGVLPTSEGVINAKQENLREFKPLFCKNQHVANTKIAPKCTFCPKNDLFWPLFAIPSYTHAIRPILGMPRRKHSPALTRIWPVVLQLGFEIFSCGEDHGAGSESYCFTFA